MSKYQPSHRKTGFQVYSQVLLKMYLGRFAENFAFFPRPILTLRKRSTPGYIFFFLIFKLFYCCSITVVFIFSPPLYPTPAKPTSSPASTLPFGFVHVSFIVVPENPSPHYSFPPPLWLLLYCS